MPTNEENIYSQIMDGEGQDQESSLKQSMFVGTKSNPDVFAQDTLMSQETNIPVDVVARNKETIQHKSNADAIDYGTLIDNNPVLSKWLENVDNSSLAHDDVPNLGDHENKIKEYNLLQTWGRSAVSGAAGIDAAIMRIPAFIYDTASILPNDFYDAVGLPQVRSPEWLRNNPAAKYYDAQQEAWSVPELNKSTISQAIKGDFAGAGRTLIAQVLANAPQQLFILGSAMAGMPAVGLGFAGATQGAQANKTAQESGVAPIPATIDALSQGSLEMLFEDLGTLSIFRKMEKTLSESIGKESSKQVMKHVGMAIAQSAVVEGTEEFFTQIGQDFSDYFTGVNPNALQGMFQRAVDAGLVGAAAGGTQTGPISIASGASRARQLRQIEQTREFYLSLGNTAEASKLRERMPDAHRQYVESLTKGTPVENIYVPVEAWDMYMQSKNTDPAAAAGEVGITKEYDQAKETGKEIKIPLALWASKVVGTEHYAGLANDIKFNPAEQTVNERKAEDEQIKAETEAAHQAAINIQTTQAQAEILKQVEEEAKQIQENIAEQLKSTGKFSDKDSKLLAQLVSQGYKNLGGRRGLNPLAFFGQNPMSVKAQDTLAGVQPGQTELNQTASSVISYVKDGKKFYTRITPEELTFLQDEVKNIPTPMSGESQIHLDAITPNLQKIGTELSREEFISGHSQAGELLGQQVFSQNQPDPLAAILFGKSGLIDIRLLKNMNFSSFLHETGHGFLELLRRASVGTDVPADIQDMSAKTLKWLGIESWDQLERKHHEQFAQGFEKYLFEGKSPSEGLRQVFARFRVWLTSVYKTLQGLNVELSDDIRGVMDRILASDEEISKAQAEQSQEELIKDPIAILGEEKGKRYQEAVKDAAISANFDMTIKLMEEYQRERKSWWMDELKRISKEVAQEINERPEQIAISILQRGKFPDGNPAAGELAGLKINEQDLIRFYGNQFDTDVAEADYKSLEAGFHVENLEGIIKDIEQFRKDVGKIKRYKDNYLKEELDKIPPRYLTTNKFAKTLDEAAQDLGFESDQALIEKMVENEDTLKGKLIELTQAKKEFRSLQKQYRDERFKSIKDALRALPRDISGPDGLAVDMVGQMFGFSSPEQFLDILSRTRPRNELIKEISHQKMVEQYGELYGNKQEMYDAAQQAIHTEKREQILRMELEYLAEQHMPVVKDLIRTVSARIPSSDTVKKYAADIIGKTAVGELSSYQYRLAERRMAKAAGIALAKGDFVAAFDAKKKELLNYELYRAAVAARENINNSLDNFKKFSKSDEKLSKSRDIDYVNAARAILAMYGLSDETEDPYSFLKNTQVYDPDIYETLTALVDAATENAGDFKTINYYQFLNMKEAVDAIWEISRRSKVIEIEGKKMELDEVRAHLIARIQEMVKPGAKGGYTKSATENDKFIRGIMGAVAQGRRVESWVDVMDGGDSKGWFTRAIWNPVIEGTQQFRIKNREYTEKFLNLVKNIESSLKEKQIVSDELKHIFNSKAELLGALLHTGNESNLSKLLRGRGWGMYLEDGSIDRSRWDAFINRMQREGILNKADYDFIQSIWDLFEEIKPAAQRAHKEIYGYYFNEITKNEFTTPWGTYRGGYAPAIVDPFVSEDAAIRQEKADAEQINNSYMFPTTGRGFTKSRVERYAAPLAMDLRLVPQHINKALRFAYIEPHIKDVGRIIRNQEFREYLRDLDPVVGQQMLSPWLQRAAQQIVETPDKSWAGWRIWRELRTRSGINIMAGNVVNTLQQFTGLSIAAIKVKPKYLRNALWNYMRNPKAMAEYVRNNSNFMKTRTTTQIIEINKNIDDIILNQGKYQKAIDFAKQHAYFMQQGTQNVVDMVVWPGAYDQSVANGNTHEQAVKDADAAVRLTQGDFSPENVSNLESGNAFARAFLMFYSYFNMQANLLGTEFSKVSRDLGMKRGAGKLFYIYMMGFMIPAVVSQVILKALSGEPWDKDDDGYLDDIMAIFFGSQFQTATAMIPFAGQIANVVVNKFNKKWYDDDIRASPAISMIESASHSPYSVYKAIADDGNRKTAIRDVLSLLGLFTGTPASALSKPLGYLSDVDQGNFFPENALDFTRGLITGKTGN